MKNITKKKCDGIINKVVWWVLFLAKLLQAIQIMIVLCELQEYFI